ncbi:MAG: NRDE family protein [Proteobacteria bacterium]|nr:NRDE family protein [Pseudomonadota bacterium]
MCLILFAYSDNPKRPLVIAANRDEVHARPTLACAGWADYPAIIAGRDLKAGGTWLGLNQEDGRFAAVTNFTDPQVPDAPASRGDLARDYLNGRSSAQDFAEAIDHPAYRGFNLLLWDSQHLIYTSNRGDMRVLKPGIYGLANALLGAQWPKVLRGTRNLGALLEGEPCIDSILDLLNDQHQPPDHQLPERGNDIEMERRVAPCFLVGEEYGTRASTALIHLGDRVLMSEQQYAPGGVTGARTDFSITLGK